MNYPSLKDEFVSLYKTKELTDCNNRFVKDGIINPALFAQQKIRVLFIAKEHNDLDPTTADETYTPDYSVWWNHHIHLQFSHRVSEWAYGIINDFPDYSGIEEGNKKHEALKSIAFINVKKVSGGAAADPILISKYIEYGRELLHRQIAEIAPTIIVCCFRDNWYVEHLFGFGPMKSTVDKLGVGIWNNINVVNFYHPSARKSKHGLYSQLKEVIALVKAQ